MVTVGASNVRHVTAAGTRSTSLLRERPALRSYNRAMEHMQILRVSAKLLSILWGGLGVFWLCRFMALWPADLAYRALPLMVACFAAALVLLGGSRFLPQPASRPRRATHWTSRLMKWADEL
jgi:hypothetical protein